MTRVENRWFARLQGLKGQSVESGEFDLYVLMATQYKWTPEQVNALDPHFLEELMAFQAAEARHAEKERKDAEAQAKRDRAGRGR